MSYDVAELLADLASVTALPGARCRGHSATFDPAAPGEDPDVVQARHAQALGLCAACPSLRRCEGWLDGLPRHKRPYGVVAGQVRLQRVRTTNRTTS